MRSRGKEQGILVPCKIVPFWIPRGLRTFSGMSLRRRSLPPGDRSHPVVSFACVGQPHPLLPPACHATIASHAPWSSVSTLGELQSPVQHAYGAHVDVSITATPQIQKKMVASGSASPQCPLVPLPQLSRSSFHVGYYVPPSVEPGDPYG